MNTIRIKKGDKVKIITGKNRGTIGEVIRVFPLQNRVIVSGVNIVKKHTKPSKTSEGGIIKKELPIHVSNVSYIDNTTQEITKIGYKILECGKKTRLAKKSGEIITKEGKK
jgi:large subunit ribosomal protein L24